MTRKEAFNMLDQMARGIAEMFGSNCETIIHDLEDPHHPILAIYNGHVSGRTVGSTQDLTGAERDLYLDDDVVNSLAVTPSGQQVLLDLMHTEVDFHSALYKPKDTGISELFDSAVLRVGKPAREMNKADRLRVIEYLSGMDAFSYRRAVPYVASHLGVSRYTVYKYLDEVNGKINKASAKDKED